MKKNSKSENVFQTEGDATVITDITPANINEKLLDFGKENFYKHVCVELNIEQNSGEVHHIKFYGLKTINKKNSITDRDIKVDIVINYTNSRQALDAAVLPLAEVYPRPTNGYQIAGSNTDPELRKTGYSLLIKNEYDVIIFRQGQQIHTISPQSITDVKISFH